MRIMKATCWKCAQNLTHAQGVILQQRNHEGGEYLTGILLVDLSDILNRI